MEDEEIEDPLQIIANEKEEGNRCWKINDYENASKAYSKALLAINHLLKQDNIENNEQLEDIIMNIQLPCMLNLSACYLKQGYGYENVETLCSNALNIQSNNLKALYRRAVAYTHLEKFKEARKDIEAGLRIDPKNDGLLKAQVDLEKRWKRYKEKSKKIAQEFIGNNKSVPSIFREEENSKWRCWCCRRKVKLG